MKCLLVVDRMNDVLFADFNDEFAKHVNQEAVNSGLIQPEEMLENPYHVDSNIVMQLFSPLVLSQWFLIEETCNPCSSITCQNGFLFVFRQLDDLLFIAINGDESETKSKLQRKILVFHRLVGFLFGPVTDEIGRSRYQDKKQRWNFLRRLLDTWSSLFQEEQSFLVEATERLMVNQCVNEAAIDLLETAVHRMDAVSDRPTQHALLLVNSKLLSLYTNRNAPELQASDMLCITLLVRDLFPGGEKLEDLFSQSHASSARMRPSAYTPSTAKQLKRPHAEEDSDQEYHSASASLMDEDNSEGSRQERERGERQANARDEEEEEEKDWEFVGKGGETRKRKEKEAERKDGKPSQTVPELERESPIERRSPEASGGMPIPDNGARRISDFYGTPAASSPVKAPLSPTYPTTPVSALEPGEENGRASQEERGGTAEEAGGTGEGAEVRLEKGGRKTGGDEARPERGGGRLRGVGQPERAFNFSPSDHLSPLEKTNSSVSESSSGHQFAIRQASIETQLDGSLDYWRQTIFLQTPRCQYSPHQLHCTQIKPGTVLVLLTQGHKQSVAEPLCRLFLYVRDLLAGARSTSLLGGNFSQDTYDTMNSYFSRVRSLLKRSSGHVEKILLEMKKHWDNENTKTALLKFLNNMTADNFSTRLEMALSELYRRLKELFSLLFLSPRAANDAVEAKVKQLQGLAQSKLNDFSDFLSVKAVRNVTMTCYMNEYPDMLHFIYIDRQSHEVTAPSLNITEEVEAEKKDATNQLKERVWRMYEVMMGHLSQGITAAMVTDGDMRYSYFLWFEDSRGQPMAPQEPFNPAVLPPVPGILTGKFYRRLVQTCFPRAVPGSVHCYELYMLHSIRVSPEKVAEQGERLARHVWEMSIDAITTISLL